MTEETKKDMNATLEKIFLEGWKPYAWAVAVGIILLFAVVKFSNVYDNAMIGPGGHNAIGFKLMEQGKLDDAEKEFRKELDKNPNFVPALDNIGVVFARKNRWREAADAWLKRISVDPNYTDVYQNLSVAAFQLQDFQQAKAFMDEFVRRGGNPAPELVKALEPYTQQTENK